VHGQPAGYGIGREAPSEIVGPVDQRLACGLFETVVNLIANTTTTTGLTVQCDLDSTPTRPKSSLPINKRRPYLSLGTTSMVTGTTPSCHLWTKLFHYGSLLSICESSERSIVIYCRFPITRTSSSNIADDNGMVTAGDSRSNLARKNGKRISKHGKPEIAAQEFAASKFIHTLCGKTSSKWFMFVLQYVDREPISL